MMKRIRPKFNPRPRALALVSVLWIVMILTVVVAVTAKTSRLDTRITMAGTEQITGKWANRAALETALALLVEDPPESDGIADFWTLYPEYSELVEMPGCVFSIRFEDEASKLNVNTATYEQLMWLPYMTEEVADAIIDWRDQDDNPEPLGAEGVFYLNLPFPYLIRNGEFRTIRELMLVNGVTYQLLYGEDANSNGQLDYNENDGDQQPPLDNGDGILDLGLISYLTCYTQPEDEEAQPLVNVNTASEYVLTALLGGDITLAENIIAYRQSTTEGIMSVEELLEVQGMSDDAYQQLRPLVTVRSNIWTIHCTTAATRTGALFFSEAVVDRSQQPIQVLFWHQGAKH